MSEIEIAFLALVRGVSEFLPVGAERPPLMVLKGLARHGGAMLVAVQAGLLLALLAALRSELWSMGMGLWRVAKGRRDPGARLALQVAVAAIPSAGIGWLVAQGQIFGPGTPLVVGCTTVAAGLALAITDRLGLTLRRIEHMTLLGALVLGTVQGVALLPGAGRAGPAVALARLMGYERVEAFRFSLLLSVPAVAAMLASGLGRLNAMPPGGDALAALTVSFGLAWLAATLAGWWLRRNGFTPFALYQMALGGTVIALGM
ncbi:MAG: undecaprenyl-diphosphate phosphatase [Alphaproteobacteria bacterium]|nr:undecaprenyl-diphosphate phosphatase [Alphaproteobacteria bacterium]